MGLSPALTRRAVADASKNFGASAPTFRCASMLDDGKQSPAKDLNNGSAIGLRRGKVVLEVFDPVS
jgi:hypothetical protein